ncbi:DUF2309 domain-containing protein [Halorientalis pallida]|uniref:Probable inorganic carbon transporter subunit DabA n=1 Tax=Halorientalis pallida TaxID=2479928 RepID=A0A498L5S3_9EURY|nr:DUF2309 domain-containing protein [Halorientalis pallida]RXK50035.1 DUF2309 domain-containing protein [Halorientalis pallida]
MNTDSAISESIEQAADSVGSVWPLHSFVTANPLAGFEDRPFHEAVAQAEDLLGGDGYPSPAVFRRAWETGRIDPDVLAGKLDEHGSDADPEALLDRLEATADSTPGVETAETPADRVDAVLTKWLAAFLDQGTATWSMPDREQGFYAAVRSVAPHDGDIPDGSADAWPAAPAAAIERALDDHPRDEWPSIFEHHLTALPGWTGFIKQRAADDGAWQSTYPITLAGYLAVRLTLADLFDASIQPAEPSTDAEVTDDDAVPLEEVCLAAWEASYRSELVDAVADGSAAAAEADDDGRPDAQFVFCIDTRSEIVRRHVEAAGDYETHGYAGFFGIPMRYEGYDADVSVDACPPILDAQHRITDRPTADAGEQAAYDRWSSVSEAGGELVKSLKSNAATAFSYVESAGSGYGLALAARTLLPGRVYDAHDAADERVPDDHEFCEPSVDYNPDAVTEIREGLTLDEKVEYAATAFELMGWEQFARLVVFAGHASETANNPYDSSLDCGACAGNPGGPNARVLAAICNDADVRAELRERGHDVPEDTVFVAGEHNTTTDEIDLFDGPVPESHADDLDQLRADLETARAGAAAERAADMGADEDAGVRETERRAADWAETRPEWGLAGNAGFVVGPRDLTANLDLDGRSFLHSYDWSTDADGDALEAIVTGPMVVTQWINTQYYFATVDTGVYGSGSKVTHNPVGNVGVYQGNGGDLMTGLPLQSLMAADDEPYHQPLRLSTVIHAPVARVTEILADHETVAELLDNGWLSLTVVDPEQDHRAFHYDGDLTWVPMDATEPTLTEAESAPESVAADD